MQAWALGICPPSICFNLQETVENPELISPTFVDPLNSRCYFMTILVHRGYSFKNFCMKLISSSNTVNN